MLQFLGIQFHDINIDNFMGLQSLKFNGIRSMVIFASQNGGMTFNDHEYGLISFLYPHQNGGTVPNVGHILSGDMTFRPDKLASYMVGTSNFFGS